jgi:hypothetical protein
MFQNINVRNPLFILFEALVVGLVLSVLFLGVRSAIERRTYFLYKDFLAAFGSGVIGHIIFELIGINCKYALYKEPACRGAILESAASLK